jgi:hypothetical protein
MRVVLDALVLINMLICSIFRVETAYCSAEKLSMNREDSNILFSKFHFFIFNKLANSLHPFLEYFWDLISNISLKIFDTYVLVNQIFNLSYSNFLQFKMFSILLMKHFNGNTFYNTNSLLFINIVPTISRKAAIFFHKRSDLKTQIYFDGLQKQSI